MGRTPATWLLLLHVLAALWLAGGAFAGAVVRAQTKRADSLAQKVLGLRIAWRLATVFNLPGGIVSGLLGIALIPARGHSMAAGWIHVSLTLWLLIVLNGIFYLMPRLKRTLAAAEASLAAGAPTPELQALASAKLPGILADVNALGIVVLTFLMVIRPF